MDRKEIIKQRHNILSELDKVFNEEMVPAKIETGSREGVEVLSVILDGMEDYEEDALGEFFFLPGSDDDDVQFFVNLITILEDVSEKNFNELCATVAALNTYVVVGGFAIDFPARSVVYKNTYEMPIDCDFETMKNGVDMSMEISLKIVNQFAYILDEVNSGSRSAASVINLFVTQ